MKQFSAQGKPEEIIKTCLYISYATQRDRAPEVAIWRWKRIYGFSEETLLSFEAIYQAERNTN